VGIGCRFPGGLENTEALWEALVEGRDCITDIPSDRWDPKKFYDPSGKSPGRSHVHKGGMLTNNIHEFDASFFGISPREAEVMDPMQRLLLEVSWEAFEDAGISPKSLAGTDMAVFVGGFVVDSIILQYSVLNRNELGPQSAVSSSLTMLSNRLSYYYDLRGPSMSLDTACSSSLVAVHQACQSIWSGESNSALVGGVSMLLAPETQITMSKGQFLSPNGRCNTFGSGADGYVRGEGSALVVLKPLSQAIADGNQIYSVIRGTAVNQDGKTNGITVPNGESQKAAMKRAYSMANIQPSQIDYMEAHGTGTPVGDPIEASALGSVLSMGRSKHQPCPMGSIKTNLGHMEASAGVAGLIKAALVLKNRKLVPHLHLDELNTDIDLEHLNLRIPNEVESLSNTGALFAGVNSFGYGGTNAHVVLESPPTMTKSKSIIKNSKRPIVLQVSAACDESLTDIAQKMLKVSDVSEPELRQIAIACATQKSHLNHRAWLQGYSPLDIIKGLQVLAKGERRADQLTYGSHDQSRVMFVYTGMGPQWWAMGRELYQNEAVYREAIDECERLFKEISGWSILNALNASEEDSKITHTNIAQPANLVIQVGITRLLESWGVTAEGIVGHSIGEVAAAWASGGLSLKSALTVAYHRSRLQHTTAGKGAMLAAGLVPEEANKWLLEFGEKISIAAINSPSSVTFAGDKSILESIAVRLEEQQLFNKFLNVEVPYHSPIMNEIETRLFEALDNITTDERHTPLISTVTGEEMLGSHCAEYWWKNVRQSVLFSKAISTALASDYSVFIEIGPHPVLASSIIETAKNAAKKVLSVSTLIRKQDEMTSLSHALGKLYSAGINPDWSAYFGSTCHTKLPSYPWHKNLFWNETERAKQYRLPHQGHPLVSRTTSVPTLAWHVELNAEALPFIQDHQVMGSVLFPGAGYVELGLGLVRHLNSSDADAGITLEDVEFIAPAKSLNNKAVSLIAKPDITQQRYHVYYKQGNSDAQLCAQGKYFSGGRQPEPIQLSLIEKQFDVTQTDTSSTDQDKSIKQFWDKGKLYQTLSKRGLVYGPSFQAVEKIYINGSEVLSYISLPENLNNKGYLLHPVLLDAAIHSLIAGDVVEDVVYDVIPVGIKRIQWFGEVGKSIVAHGRICQRNSETITGDITLYTEKGEIAGLVKGLSCRLLPKTVVTDLEKINQWTYERSWQPSSLSPAYNIDQKTAWLILNSKDSSSLINFSDIHLNQSITVISEPLNSAQLTQFLDEKSSESIAINIIDLRYYFNQEQTNGCKNDTLIDDATNITDELLNTFKSLSDYEFQHYFLLTRNNEKVIESDKINLITAPMTGFARTAMTERPRLNICLVDTEIVNNQSVLLNQLNAINDEQEIAFRGEETFVLRICPTLIDAPQIIDHRIPANQAKAYEMRQAEKGRMDTIEYFEVDRIVPKNGEVEIEMAYSSLHFKDLMKTMGVLSSAAENDTFYKGSTGMEGSGIISAVGPNVTHLKIGDRVYTGGLVMRSHLILPAGAIAIKIPDQLSLQDCTNLVTYQTVYHSLVEMARLKKGETVLIHSATGGIGLAAINLARYLGAKIIATAGSDEKRAYLKEIGIKHVSNSRSLAFVDDVQDWTNGKGVDVVLNFTPGEIMTKSLHCLAPFGRFIELGKQSFDRDEAINLRPFMENLSYISVDFDRMYNSQPLYAFNIANKILSLLSSGELKPLPCEIFPTNQTIEAFRTMARAKYIGKLAISHQDDALLVQPNIVQSLFCANASYIITGGLGGFGLQVAEWMSVNGAGHLVLLSRSGASSSEAKEAITLMENRGTKVHAYSADVSDLDRLKEIFTHVESQLPEIKGVMHAAMVLDDKLIQEMDHVSLQKVINAKAKGAWNLHQLTEQLNLDFMILFSSISSLVGNAGQSNYVAANNFLDQLAIYRKSNDLPCLSINWGVFQETGVVARNEHLAKHLSNIGITPFLSTDATLALGLALSHPKAQLGIMDVDWQRFSSLLPAGSGNSRFKLLESISTNDDPKQDDKLFNKTFGDTTTDERLIIITEKLSKAVATVMRMDLKDIKPTQSLRDLGLDSLMAVEIDVEFSAMTGLDIPSAELSSGPSIDVLGKALLTILDTKLPATKASKQTSEA